MWKATMSNQTGNSQSTDNKDENKDRGNWSNQLEFIFSALGAAVGLGNVWRFPYLCYTNGGGAFLFPYFIMLFAAALPLYFLELAVGQYSSQGIYTAWNGVPLLKGMGIGQTIIKFLNCMTYNVIMMYCFFYLFASMTRVLPWVGCSNSWNTDLCSTLPEDCFKAGGIITLNNTCEPVVNLTLNELDVLNITKDVDGYNLTGYDDPFADDRVTASEEYWTHRVLQQTDSMDNTGGLVWQLACCLILAWVVTYICMIKGIKSIGKVAYVTVVAPYLLLFIFLIHGVTLPGAIDGISFFIVPRWESLRNANVWVDAAVQIIFSLGVAGGSPMTMASYNKFHSNFYRDAIIISIANSLSSVFAGFVIFSTIGFMAHETGKSVENVVSQGFGLAFIVYPEAVAKMPAGPLWAALFFITLITLGIDSQIAGVEVIVTAIIDVFPRHLRRKKSLLTFLVCLLSLFCGFICATRAGGYWAAMIDQYSVNFHKLVFTLAEAVGICWIYGFKRFSNDVRSMIGDKWVDHKSFWYLRLHLCVVAPITMLILLFTKFLNWKDPEYKGSFPDWAVGLGWLIMLSSLIVIPMDWIATMTKSSGSFLERLHLLIIPDPKWGPALIEHRLEASEIHQRHGTSMGGLIDPDAKNSDSTAKNSDTKSPDTYEYSELEQI